MPRKNIRIIFVIAIFAMFVLLIAGRLLNREQNGQAETALTDSHPVADSALKSFSTVSLPALMEKQYDGRDFKLGNILDDNAFYVRYYITYKSGDLLISGIMNLPKNLPPKGGFPVLVLNHGHIETSVYTNGRGLKREQDYLARQGFAVIHPDYRNHAQSDKDPEAETNLRIGYTEDVINAVYAIKKSGIPNLNTDSIGMLGHSMGGGIALNVMVSQPNLIKAFVLYAPVSANYGDNFKRWTERNPDLAGRITDTYGSPESDPEFWKNISAESFISRIQGPVLIFHGTKDSSVPYEWSSGLEQNLVAAGKEAKLITYPGEAHEFGSKWNDFMSQTAEFFNRNLKQS